MFQKPLKVSDGVVRQFQAGDVLDPQILPSIGPMTLFTLRAGPFVATTPEALLTLTPSRNFVDGTPGTSFQPAAGARGVVVGMSATVMNDTANRRGCIYRLRCNPNGNVTITSPIIGLLGVGNTVNVANVINGNQVNLSTDQWAITLSGTAKVGVTQEGIGGNQNFLLWGFEYVP